jgi:hypothetical protein
MRKLMLLPAAILAASCGYDGRRIPAKLPSPALSPDEVVRIQVAALQHYNEPTPNAGIWLAFQFASPANRQVTGPYGHFLQLIKSPANAPFLHAQSVRFHPPRQTASQAEEQVDLTDERGTTTEWRFLLSKQRGSSFANCWMTDGVQRGAQ